jgi:hypothetical protein
MTSFLLLLKEEMILEEMNNHGAQTSSWFAEDLTRRVNAKCLTSIFG